MQLTLLSTLLLLPTAILAKVGGPCSGSNNNGDCICLDKDYCQSLHHSVVVPGKKGDYPCPSDPKNVVGCYVDDCGPGVPIGHSACTFQKGCSDVNGQHLPNPTCPGGSDYFCCKFNAP